MKKSGLILFGMLVSFLINAGCTRDLPLPDISAKKEIVLLGELIANDSINFRGGQSIPLSSGSVLKFDLPDYLTVSIQAGASPAVPIVGRRDEFTDMVHTLVFSSLDMVQPGGKYALTAYNDQLGTATCAVTIPKAFDVDIIDTATILYSGSDLFKVQVTIDDDGSKDNFYVLEALRQKINIDGSFVYNGQTFTVSGSRNLYDSLKQANVLPSVQWDSTFSKTYDRIDIYTNDANTENIKLSNVLSTNRRILLSDKTFNGNSYTTSVYLDKTLFTSASDSSKGQIVVLIKSVCEPYFDFLKGYEMYEPTTGFTSLAQPVKIDGNIQNGMGIIGGVYQHKFVYLFDKWNF
jgi:hypothetical protein